MGFLRVVSLEMKINERRLEKTSMRVKDLWSAFFFFFFLVIKVNRFARADKYVLMFFWENV